MANTNAPFGLRPVRYMSGSPWNGQVRQYYVPSTDNTALFRGDPVVIVGDSNDNEILGNPPGSLSEVTIATGGDTPGTGTFVTGVMWGAVPVTADSTRYRVASTERVIYVVDDPDVIFEIQDDGSAALTADSVGLNAVLLTGTGSTVTGLSGWTMDANADAPAADASNQLLILGLAKKQNNAIGVYAIWEVLINAHTMVRPSLGIA
jgi:hypothetical protein